MAGQPNFLIPRPASSRDDRTEFCPSPVPLAYTRTSTCGGADARGRTEDQLSYVGITNPYGGSAVFALSLAQQNPPPTLVRHSNTSLHGQHDPWGQPRDRMRYPHPRTQERALMPSTHAYSVPRHMEARHPACQCNPPSA